MCMNYYQLHKKKGQSGFTLIEMVLYIGIVAIISVLAMQSLFIMIRAFTNIRIMQDLNQSGTVAMERMAFEVRSAYDVDLGGSILNSSPGVLALLTTDSGGSNTTAGFSVTTGTLRVSEGGIDAGALTAPNITVDSLIFNSVITANSEAVKIEIQLSATRGNTTETKTFYDTIILRDSY